LSYPAPGEPALAREICVRLHEAGIASVEGPVRGFDHGVFIPLMLMYPQADIPVVQLSLQAALEPAAHLAIGRALAPLRARNILLLGSGLSYHNLARMMSKRAILDDSDEFDAWLCATCALPRSVREARLCEWSTAPAARSAHPREEHLLPLMVAAGAGNEAGGALVFHDRVMGSTVSAFAFE
jgi:aromatic ring-opening dioxygenase catalytic subunit (LigB family)